MPIGICTVSVIACRLSLNDMPVTIVGSHAGLTVGPDGATHQMLEDIALMRSLPNMIVVAPADSVEAQAATIALARTNKPSYLRLVRNDTLHIFEPHKFEIGKAYTVYEGNDVTLAVTGTMLATALQAAMRLRDQGIGVDVIHMPTIKPLDTAAILKSIKKTGRLVTLEEGQITAGFGSAIAEFTSEAYPLPVKRLGIHDSFGESGTADELLRKHRLDVASVTSDIHSWVQHQPQYRH
jgi:transketolase